MMTVDQQPQTSTLAEGRVIVWAGEISVAASEYGVRDVSLPRWVEDRDPSRNASGEITITEQGSPAATAHLRQALEELAEYFAGARRDFTAALDPIGAAFYQRVWTEVARVPYGETRSYGEIAAVVGAPQASRAVGTANATNPLAPFISCHRIVGSDGRLTGYGPGLPLKFRLLRMEGALPDGPDDYDAWVDSVAARAPGEPLYLGVRRAKVYCLPSCERARAASDLPARFFTSPLEAELAGFAPCSRCHSAA
ncbi:MAG TPA: methylated-DNA--[protein]-cysteine S-methyltransferase [Ktedonobacterales bacterium]|jgi:methylated-DNA-[protein]-cysteine S-methyltransferase